MNSGTIAPPVNGHAFIGVSLDNKLFSGAWIRYAIELILERHESLIFLLADDLLRYTRTAAFVDDECVLDFDGANKKTEKRRSEFRKFLKRHIDRLELPLRDSITIKVWSDFSDHVYVDILRNLHIAFCAIPLFTEAVNIAAEAHVIQAGVATPSSLQTSAAFILDEVAMCLRVTEMEGHANEYYPSKDINVLTALYADKFSHHGLTVENLVRGPRRRAFFTINEPSNHRLFGEVSSSDMSDLSRDDPG
jgi:tRNA-dependent cyclodipeptide synthase